MTTKILPNWLSFSWSLLLEKINTPFPSKLNNYLESPLIPLEKIENYQKNFKAKNWLFKLTSIPMVICIFVPTLCINLLNIMYYYFFVSSCIVILSAATILISPIVVLASTAKELFADN